MICERYRKMYHRQLEHECGSCMMVLRHVLAVLCEMLSVTSLITDGQVEEASLHVLHALQILVLDFYL
jgi:hypothetical protein